MGNSEEEILTYYNNELLTMREKLNREGIITGDLKQELLSRSIKFLNELNDLEAI